MNNESTNTFMNKLDAFLIENNNYIKPVDKEEMLIEMARIFEEHLTDEPRKVDDVE
ncbi:hypothetical protein [Pseudomonas sp. C 49-2]|uniref:hypothetical protein n=1 Tax=Pseudomonas sp. C 49-2 TaxID=2496849 RepID=UPI00131580F5|nr:hypothetical protein [Pseudomonas sp. C 49-2]